jgi:hypothetical protein
MFDGSEWKYNTQVIVKDEQKQVIAGFIKNTCWARETVFLATKDSTKTHRLTETTPENKSKEIAQFLGDYKLAANLFSATSNGRDLDNALQEEGHQVIIRNNM